MSREHRADLAIVGAGIVGLAHAFAAARQGLRVVVFEKSPRASGASIRNFGLVWPIGQRRGEMLEMALRSRELWKKLLNAADLWYSEGGSLHLAYEEDEACVLREFLELSGDAGYACRWLTPEDIEGQYPHIVRKGLKGGLLSQTELQVDPPRVIAQLPSYLHQQYGVDFHFSTPVTAVDPPKVVTSRGSWEASSVLVCSGSDLVTLYPEVFASTDLKPCKLQMMAIAPPSDFYLGPSLAAGLTLRHYPAFEACPSRSDVSRRVMETMPAYERYGIHVLVSQNSAGELIIGDSHQYGDDISIFDQSEIDELIWNYLQTFLSLPEHRFLRRWHGIYVKSPSHSYFEASPKKGVRIITGLGGAGMTLSFGLAERTLKNLYRDL